MSLRTATIPVCIAGVLLGCCVSSLAGTIGLTWDPSVGATGYRVYYGSDSGDYFPQPLYDGPQTSTVINSGQLADCTDWYFVVTAYNGAGESDYSEEVSSWTRPRVVGANPDSAMQGSQLAVTISGASFDPGATLETDNPHLYLENASISCNQIQVLATVEPMAENVRPAAIGEVSLTVTSPNGLSDTRPGAFEVLINPVRFDVNRSEPSTDGRIDGLDTVWLASIFGSQEGDALYDPDFDFDGDGWVDGTDLSHIGSNFGLCWSGEWMAEACQ